MAKYVCDYDKVANTARIMNEKAKNITSTVASYEGKIKSSIANWDSTTKNNFTASDNKQVEVLKTTAKTMEYLSIHLNNVNNSIQSLEQSLSSINI